MPALAGTGGGEHVEVEGSFDNWQSRQRMQRSGKDYTIVKLLAPGVYQATPFASGHLRQLPKILCDFKTGTTAVWSPWMCRAGFSPSLFRLCFEESESTSARHIFRTTLLSVQYKFIVDGEWRYDPSLPAMYDEDNNVNNVLEVQEFVPENLDSLTGFDGPPSPPERQVSCTRGGTANELGENLFLNDRHDGPLRRHLRSVRMDSLCLSPNLAVAPSGLRERAG